MTKITVNDFIPLATKYAMERAKEVGTEYEVREGAIDADGYPSRYKHDFFTEFFHSEMDRLTKAAGIRV